MKKDFVEIQKEIIKNGFYVLDFMQYIWGRKGTK